MRKCISNWIRNNYGSKRGLLNYAKYQAKYHLGFYKKYQVIDWNRVERLVFVCHGNICRSPLGEYYARSLGANVESCGLACGNDHPADPRAIGYAENINLDMTAHKTRNISNMDFAESDLIVVMEPAHVLALDRHRLGGAQVTMAGIWHPRPRVYIHDPYSSSGGYFSACELAVTEATEVIVGRVG